MSNKLTIKLGDRMIVAEINDRNQPDIPPEIMVYVQDKDGTIVQDICVVGPHYEYSSKTQWFETDNEFVDCLVYGDSDDEDYTDKFVIGVYEEEEE